MRIPASSLNLRLAAAPDIVRAEALVLRVRPFSRTSHVVTWLTRDGRRLVVSVKGAQRPDSTFLGQYDLFYSCELLYYARSRDGIHHARECAALRRRDNLRSNWRAARCASWFAALADLVAGADFPVPGLYRLLDETLDALDSCAGAPPPALFARYEAKLLAEAGLAPNFSAPDDGARRGRGGVAVAGRLRFDLAEGRLADPEPSAAITPADPADGAPERRAAWRHAPVVRIPASLPALYEAYRASPSVGAESSLMREEPAGTGSLLRFLGLFLRFHVPDAPSRGRALALEALGAGYSTRPV